MPRRRPSAHVCTEPFPLAEQVVASSGRWAMLVQALRVAFLLFVALSMLAAPTPAAAQPARISPSVPSPLGGLRSSLALGFEELGGPSLRMKLSLRERVAEHRGEHLLIQGRMDQRLRGVNWLARLNSDRSRVVLMRWLGQSPTAETLPALLALQVLADHLERSSVHAFFVARFPRERPGSDAQRVVAMALAEFGSRPAIKTLKAPGKAPSSKKTKKDAGAKNQRARGAKQVADATKPFGTLPPEDKQERALVPLVAAIAAGGEAGKIAAEALLRFPPAGFAVFLRGELKPKLPLVRFLGKFGDPRAIPYLRHHFVADDDSLKDGIAVALARLNDDTGLAAALRVAGANPPAKPAHKQAAAEVLLRLRRPEGRRIVREFLQKPGLAASGLRLARLNPHAQFIAPLTQLAERVATDAGTRSASIALLAQLSHVDAMKALARLSTRPASASAAVLAVARQRTPRATAVLARMLQGTSQGQARRLVVRGCLARWLRHQHKVPGLADALIKLRASSDIADRSLAVFGRIVFGGEDPAPFLRAKESSTRRAAARAVVAQGPRGWNRLRPLLRKANKRPTPQQILAAPALLYPQPQLSGSLLLWWAESDSLMAPIAAFRLAARDPKPLRKRLLALLHNGSWRLRRHIALGLAHSPEADATGILFEVLRQQQQPSVRRAALVSLVFRGARFLPDELRRIRLWDPSASLRGLAAAVGTRRQKSYGRLLPSGRDVALLRLTGGGNSDITSVLAAFEHRDGLMIPFAPAADGVLLVGHLPEAARLQLQFAR